jgi:hypothetical protein
VELERTARTRKAAATSERVQQAAEAAERMAAALIEEEEREQAAEAQSKVRGVEQAPVYGATPRARHDALNPCAMDTPSQQGAMEFGEGESGAAAHLPLSGLLALLLLNHQRPHALRMVHGLLRGLLGRSLLFGAGGTLELPYHPRHMMVTAADALPAAASLHIRAPMSAPDSTNVVTTAACPCHAASCSGVNPPTAGASLSAPISASAFTTSKCPC